jgi:hypothetical protein
MNNDKDEIINVREEQLKSLKNLEEKIDSDTSLEICNIEDNIIKNVENEKCEWKDYHEKILVDWADKAICYRWLHSKSANKYIGLRNLYTIPVIILSTLTGTANFAIERVPPEYQSFCQIGIGSLNIFAGIITTISQFLKINELSEAHRVSSMSWDKFYRNIRVELVKSPEDRINVNYLIKSCKDEYGRLMEISPTIDNKIINYFNKTFNVNTKIDQIHAKNSLKSLNKPEILDSLESTKNIVYKIDNDTKLNDNLINTVKKNKEQKNKEIIIENFIETFKIEYSRKPSIVELYDNLDTKIPKNILEIYLMSDKWKNKN